MRAWQAALSASVVISVGAAGAACFDLFHSTTGLHTACELAPSTSGCSDLCMQRADARAHAERACAWLGACEGPTGRNSIGECMVQARLAYDCDANPTTLSREKRKGFGNAFRRSRRATTVDACLFPNGKPPCAQVGSSCAGAPDGGPSGSVRLECTTAPGSIAVGDAAPAWTVQAEPCALFGQTCSIGGDAAVCTGSEGATGCVESQCPENGSTFLDWCGTDGIDLGLDCASTGAQRCDGYPRDGGTQWVACLPASDASCSPTLDVACDGGVARSCPLGAVETLDCVALLGDAGTCTLSMLNPAFDWTSPCGVTAPECSSDACDDAGQIVSCMRGATAIVDCTALNLGPCAVIDLGNGTGAAACTLPGR